VASLLLTTEAMVAEKPKEDDAGHGHGGGMPGGMPGM
jgi:chaperonin GroEL